MVQASEQLSRRALLGTCVTALTAVAFPPRLATAQPPSISDTVADEQPAFSLGRSAIPRLQVKVRNLATPHYTKLASEIEPTLQTLNEALEKRPPNTNPEYWNSVVDDWKGENGPVGPAINRLIVWNRTYDTSGAYDALAQMTNNQQFHNGQFERIATGLASAFAQAHLIPSRGNARGFDKYFLVGLSKAAERLPASDTRRDSILKAVRLTLENSAYSNLSPSASKEIVSPRFSREVANHIAGVAAYKSAGGEVSPTMYQQHMSALTGHFRYWSETLGGKPAPSWPKTVDPEAQGISSAEELRQANDPYVKPFMVALSVLAATRAKDAEIPGAENALKEAGKLLLEMRTLWNGSSFPYMDRDLGPNHLETKNSENLTMNPTPDLNGLIGAAYIAAGQRLYHNDLITFGIQALQDFPSTWLGQKQMNQTMYGFSVVK